MEVTDVDPSQVDGIDDVKSVGSFLGSTLSLQFWNEFAVN